jgi:hypothetical protein
VQVIKAEKLCEACSNEVVYLQFGMGEGTLS